MNTIAVLTTVKYATIIKIFFLVPIYAGNICWLNRTWKKKKIVQQRLQTDPFNQINKTYSKNYC